MLTLTLLAEQQPHRAIYETGGWRWCAACALRRARLPYSLAGVSQPRIESYTLSAAKSGQCRICQICRVALEFV